MAATFVVETGSGSASANSLCSVADADQYHENYGNPASWFALSQLDKEKALRIGTQGLLAIFKGCWKGFKKYSTQSLDWPRCNVVDDDYFAVPDTSIPQPIIHAVAILALSSLTETLVPDIAKPGAIKKKRTKTGPVEQEIEYTSGLRSTKVYSLVGSLVSQYIHSGTTIERG